MPTPTHPPRYSSSLTNTCCIPTGCSTLNPTICAYLHDADTKPDSRCVSSPRHARGLAAAPTCMHAPQVLADIVQPVADAMVAEGAPFRGVLFAGLMIDAGTATALEFNVRFGDPEVQCLMMRLRSDLLPTLRAAARGDLASAADSARTLEWRQEAALGVVMASAGYPGAYEKGTPIGGLDKVAEREAVKVFHAGTAAGAGGEGVVAVGGRVLCVTALGVNVMGAQRAAYDAVREVEWKEGQFRTDIGWRAIGREDPA